MVHIIKNKKVKWISLYSPNIDEIIGVTKDLKIHHLISEELQKPTLRSKVDMYENALYMIMHFPIFDPRTRSSSGREIDFVVGKDFIVTVYYSPIEPLDDMVSDAEADFKLREQYLGDNSGQLLFSILKKLYQFSMRELDHVHRNIVNVEEEIFKGREENMVREISIIRRDILDFRRAIQPQESVLLSLEKSGAKFFPKSFLPYLSYISGEYYRVWNTLENHKDTIESLQETNESLLSSKTNRIMRTLTLMAFMTFPLTLIVSIFGMGAKATPILGGANDFWIIVAILALLGVVMLSFFRHRRWV